MSRLHVWWTGTRFAAEQLRVAPSVPAAAGGPPIAGQPRPGRTRQVRPVPERGEAGGAPPGAAETRRRIAASTRGGGRNSSSRTRRGTTTRTPRGSRRQRRGWTCWTDRLLRHRVLGCSACTSGSTWEATAPRHRRRAGAGRVPARRHDAARPRAARLRERGGCRGLATRSRTDLARMAGPHVDGRPRKPNGAACASWPARPRR